MSTVVDESVSRSVRSSSAMAKVKLLAHGIQDAHALFESFGEFKEDNHAYDNGNWGVGRGRAVPSDLELPGGIVSKIHIRPGSPLSLVRSGSTLVLIESGRELTECTLLPRPNFWNKETALGTAAHRLVQFYGATCLNLNIFSGCQFFNVEKSCKFCSVQPTQALHRAVVIRKSPAELRDACLLAVQSDKVDWYLQTGGSHLNSDEEFENHVAVLKSLQDILPWNGRFRGNLATMPPTDLGRIEELFHLGVDHPSFNLEVWPRSAFDSICEGKSKYVGFDHILAAMDKLVDYYGPGWGWCNFVAGLVPLNDQKDGFTAVAERGIIPGANVFHPDVGSTFGMSVTSPSEGYIVELYRHAAELYHKHQYKPFFDARVLRNSLANEAFEGLLS